MVAVNLHNVEKSYGFTEVLKGFSLNINRGEKVALIGPNGSGKTTVLKIIAGLEPYSSGQVSISRDTQIGYLSQIPDLAPENTLFEEFEGVFSDLIQMESRLKELEQEISDRGGAPGGNGSRQLEKLMDNYSQLQREFKEKGGYGYRSRIKQVALGLGFSHEELQRKVKGFSGGEKTRAGLVKLLLSGPGLLLLDEPTNHLDIPSRQWLEDYLLDYDGAVLIISHDRYFLDRVVDRIVELKQGSEEVYHGNYSYYLKERQRRYQQRLKAYKNQQKKIKKMKETIEQLRVWGRSGDNEKHFKQAESIQKKLDKMDKLDKPTLGGDRMKLDFSIEKRSGDEVLMIEGLSKSFTDQPLLRGLELKLYWSQKAAIIGKNGSGKSTLLQIIMNELSKDSGQVRIGSGVRIGYYRQQFTGFNPEDDLVTALRRHCPMKEGEARDALAAFLFTEDEVFKKVKNLSGGERSRLRFLQLMCGNYNFLILDEPTNHLDLPSREVLEEAIQEYSGTVLMVSHDRYFINKIADYTYELTEEGQLNKFYGNYDYYQRKKKEQARRQKEDEDQQSDQPNRDNFYYRKKREQRRRRRQQRRIEELEQEIMELEQKKEELEQEMMAPGNIDDYTLLQELKEDYGRVESRLEELYEEWEHHLEKME